MQHINTPPGALSSGERQTSDSISKRNKIPSTLFIIPTSMLDAGSNSMEPVTPPHHDIGTLSDADGSPLPTPPRVSHVYDIKGDETWPTTPPTLRRRHQDEVAGNSVTYRPSTSRDVLQTPAISSLSRSLSVNTHAANQRSVGRGLQKLRTYSTYLNVRTYMRFFFLLCFFIWQVQALEPDLCMYLHGVCKDTRMMKTCLQKKERRRRR